MPKFPGIEFDFGGGQVMVIPPLALGDLEMLQDRLASLQLSTLDAKSIGTVIDATHAALQRNYPDTTRAQVASWIDVANFAEVIQCVMDVAGLRRKEQHAGKALAATQT